jgi:hypothetical protein
VSGDYWQVLLASQPGGQVHSLLLNAAGQRRLDGVPINAVTSTELKPGVCIVNVALPLTQIGATSGGHFYLNAKKEALATRRGQGLRVRRAHRNSRHRSPQSR